MLGLIQEDNGEEHVRLSVTTAGPFMGEAGAARDMVAAIIGDVVGHRDGPLLGACERAEAFLAGWLADLPFGRPMAA